MINNRVRIIGGYWRGKHVTIPDNTAIRSTGDRIRETLFNWLGMHLHKAHCLDLFAGSGILGLEALSRGAKQISFVDNNDSVIKHLEHTITHLPIAQQPQLFINYHLRVPTQAVANHVTAVQFDTCVHLIKQDALSPLSPSIGNYDIIFLDPPFNSDLLTTCMPLLHKYGYEKNGTLIYLEMPTVQQPLLPAHWRVVKTGQAHRVTYLLVEAVHDTK